jgi:hypothetical protein
MKLHPLFFGFVFFTLGRAPAAAPVSLPAALARPLIIGASVSNDFLTESPGKRLALRYTSPDQIKVVAENGQPGIKVLKSLDESTLDDRTSIIGVDLFFWDSFLKNSAQSEQAVENVIEEARRKDLVIVIGDVPPLRPSAQPSLQKLNLKIRQSCAAYAGCRLLPLERIFTGILQDGFLEYKSVKYSIPQLLPDGLHVTAPASEFLADKIAELLTQ